MELKVPQDNNGPPKRPRKTNYSLNMETHIPSQNQLVYLKEMMSKNNQESPDKLDQEYQQTNSGRESELYP